MKTKIILLIAVFVVGLLAALPIGISAQNPSATEIKPPSTVVHKVPPGSVVLGPGTHSENIKAFTVKRQFDVNQLRANPMITLGKTKVDLASVFKNPSALPNVATRLRAIPQLAEVMSDHMQVMEVQQGLILHHFLSYRLKPGVCSDQARRRALSSSGVRCATKISDDTRTAAFSTPGDPHYVSDPARRAVAIADAKKKSAAMQQDIASDLTKLRASLKSPADRAKIDSLRGAGESDRLSKLSDDELEGEVINSGVNKVEQVLFVPGADKLYDPKTGKSIGIVAGLGVMLPAVVDKPLSPKIFLTGFTLGRNYEWRQRSSITINRCIVACEKTYYVEVYATFDYAFGLRFPIRLDGTYHYRRAAGNEKASVTTNFAPIDGSPDDYAKTGLNPEKIFKGAELVAQFSSHAGLNYSLPIIPDDGIDVPFGKDFTDGLPAPFANGQFTPPAPGQTLPGLVKIFKDVDLIGGLANFGVAGAQVFPAVQVDLHSDSLKFTLHDNILNADTPLTSSGQETDLGIDSKTHGSSFTIGHPVYNLGFTVTPGIDAHLFIDIAVWSHSWDFPAWFPQLALHLPPDGVDFACHDGTFCTVQYNFAPQPNSHDNSGTQGDVIVKAIPVYRIYDPKNGVHFFTTDEARVEQAVALGPWKREGNPFYVLSQSTSESKTLAAYIHKFAGLFNIWTYETTGFNTNGGPEYGGKAGFWQKDQDFVIGDVLSSQKNGTVPLYKMHRPGNGFAIIPGFGPAHVPLDYDTWLVAGEGEVKIAEAKGFKNMGILGYVYLAPTEIKVKKTP